MPFESENNYHSGDRDMFRELTEKEWLIEPIGGILKEYKRCKLHTNIYPILACRV
jgi:hypothetical protein